MLLAKRRVELSSADRSSLDHRLLKAEPSVGGREGEGGGVEERE